MALMAAKFSNQQLRGAFEAGRKAGFNDGLEKMRLEGWRRVEHWSELKVGDYVKALAPTIAGWKGYGFVLHNYSGLVIIRKADDPEGRAEYCEWQLAKKWAEEQ
jgi:hypothetical protein